MSDVTEVSQLLLRERQSRVRARSDELLACFHDDATVQTSWMQGSAAAYVAGAGERSASSGAIVNRVGPPVVRVSGRRGLVELPSTTTRWIEVHGTEAVLASFMRLLYRVERRDGPWKISAMSAINEGDTLAPAVPGTDLGVNAGGLAGLRPSDHRRGPGPRGRRGADRPHRFPGPPGPRDTADPGARVGDAGVTGGLPGHDVHRLARDGDG